VSRRLVVVLFTDLVGWTRLAERLDPEPLQQFLESYYEICADAVQRHGGIVEKFIGDAVMAVFGAERSQEDDGLRALRSALRMRAEVARLMVAGNDRVVPAIHCGIAAGEALVTHSAHAGVRIVGDVVNLAARLQSAARPGEILVNEVMARLVRSHAGMTAMPAMELKGKGHPVPVWRAAELIDPSLADRVRAPMFDREDERARLAASYREVVRTGRALTMMVVGPAGIGKTRLVRDALDRFHRADPQPLTATGTCPSLAATGMYVPLGEVLDTLLADDDLLRRASTVRRGRLLEVLSHIRAPGRAAGDDAGPGTEEVSWAMREVLTRVAPRPATLVWDDLQWADPVMLDVLVDLTVSLRDHPVLMICVTRQELPGLPVPDEPFRGLLEVGPLRPLEIAGLVTHLMTSADTAEVMAHGMDVLDRVVAECDGNPLYAELMVETLALGHPLGDVPPSITALIGAMVDRLPHDCGRLLEVASVIGMEFTLDQLAMLDTEPTVGAMDHLRRRQLVVAGPRAGAYRFAQQLVHPVVYGRLDKRQRLSWHRRLAERGVDPPLHLDAAVRLLRDLRPADPELPDLAARTASALLAEGTLALRQRNLPAAVDLLRRAQELPLTDGDVQRAVAVTRLSDALFLAGDLVGARAVVEQAMAETPGSRIGRVCQILRSVLAIRAGEPVEVSLTELVAAVEQDENDHLSQSRLHQLHMLRHISDGRFRAAERSALSALLHAEAMSDRYECDRLRAAVCEVGQWSPTPIQAKLTFCAETAARFAGDRCLLVPVLVAQARLLALVGELAEATAALDEARQVVVDLRLTMAAALVDQGTGTVASLTGEHSKAEQHFRSAARALEAAGHRPAALTVWVLAVRERLRWCVDAQAMNEIRALSRQLDHMDLRGRVIGAATVARAASGPQAPVAAGEVLTLLERTDDACLRGDVLADLAVAHRRSGDDAVARTLAQAAADSYAAVGAVLPLRRVREWM
jgi:class 3 adenylate cyclase